MSQQFFKAKHAFQISLDIESFIEPLSQAAQGEKAQYYHSLLMQKLLTNPEILSRLFRLAALATLPAAMDILRNDYSHAATSEQKLIEPLIGQFEPEVSSYFAEEMEDQQIIFFFDDYSATIKRVQMMASALA